MPEAKPVPLLVHAGLSDVAAKRISTLAHRRGWRCEPLTPTRARTASLLLEGSPKPEGPPGLIRLAVSETEIPLPQGCDGLLSLAWDDDALVMVLHLALTLAAHRSASADPVRNPGLGERATLAARLMRLLIHEINNPLSAILGHAQRLGRKHEWEDVTHRRDIIVSETERLIRLSAHLRALGLPPSERRDPCKLSSILAGAQQRLAATGRSLPQVAEVADGQLRVLGDPDHLERVLAEVLANAHEAGAQNVWCSLQRGSQGRTLIICDNDGATPDADQQQQACHLFYGTKGPSHPGLGLSLCTTLLRELEGSIDLLARPEGGGRIRIDLPSDPDQVPSQLSLSGSLRILVVDAEQPVVEVVVAHLSEMGHLVEVAHSSAAARTLVDQRSFQGLILAVHLSDGSGLHGQETFLAHARQAGIKTVLLTSDPENQAVVRLVRKHGCQILVKPFHLADLTQILSQWS